mgnify:CR=1 FL=1
MVIELMCVRTFIMWGLMTELHMQFLFWGLLLASLCVLDDKRVLVINKNIKILPCTHTKFTSTDNKSPINRLPFILPTTRTTNEVFFNNSRNKKAWLSISQFNLCQCMQHYHDFIFERVLTSHFLCCICRVTVFTLTTQCF